MSHLVNCCIKVLTMEKKGSFSEKVETYFFSTYQDALMAVREKTGKTEIELNDLKFFIWDLPGIEIFFTFHKVIITENFSGVFIQSAEYPRGYVMA